LPLIAILVNAQLGQVKAHEQTKNYCSRRHCIVDDVNQLARQHTTN